MLLILYIKILSVYDTASYTELPYTQLSLLMFKFSVKSRCLAEGDVLTVSVPPGRMEEEAGEEKELPRLRLTVEGEKEALAKAAPTPPIPTPTSAPPPPPPP